MTVVAVAGFAVGAVGVLFGCLCYYHLWRWARDCETATLAVAYKGRVVVSPTLVELLLWSRKIPKHQNGQTFYKAAHVTLAIVKSTRQSKQDGSAPKPASQHKSREGVWEMTENKS